MSAMQGRTAFIVSHWLASVVKADRIIVLNRGRIVDQGTHSELLGRRGIYQDMFYEQFKSVLDRPTGA